MDMTNLDKHISSQFNEELERLRTMFLTMGGNVEEQLSNAIKAAVDSDSKLAHDVMAAGVKVNTLEKRIDAECNRIIVRRQPTAGDLRLMHVILKAVSDLERVGDEAERIASVAMDTFSGTQQTNLLSSLESMGRHVLTVLHDTLDSFSRMDSETAATIHLEDKKIDREYESVMRLLMTYMMEDPRSIPKVLNVVWAARSLERIGDRCQNITEFVIFLVKGIDVRHTDFKQVHEEARGNKAQDQDD